MASSTLAIFRQAEAIWVLMKRNFACRAAHNESERAYSDLRLGRCRNTGRSQIA